MRSNNIKNTAPEEFIEEFVDLEDIIDTNLPDPCAVEFYRRLKNREIFWNSGIDDGTIDVAMYIRKWNAEDKGNAVEDRKPIKIFINSNGGDVTAVFNVIDMIRLSKTPVYTIGMGKVFSAGGILLMAGHKRYIFEHTNCLIHDGSTFAGGSIGKMLDNLEYTKELEAKMRDFVLSSTTIPAELYDRNYRRDWFLFADEIIKYGVADEIITDIDMIL